MHYKINTESEKKKPQMIQLFLPNCSDDADMTTVFSGLAATTKFLFPTYKMFV